MRIEWKRILAGAVATLFVGFLLTGCGGGGAEAPAAATPAEPIAVTVATAETATVAERTEATGTVEAIRQVRPGTKVLGRIDRVLVREGERVERGQLLAKLESGDLEAAVAQAEAAIRMAEAELENTRIQKDRMEDLHGRGSVTDKNLEDATAHFQVASAALEQARANLAAARVTLGYAEVRSPIDGWVMAKRVEAGDMAAPGAPFFILEDLSRVKVTLQVPEAEVRGLAEGDPARVELLGTEIDARIDRIVPAADPRSRTFSVQLLLDNPEGELKSGTFARASFPRGERAALLVPADAVVTRGQLEGVFVAGDDGRARLRWVTTGHRDGDRVEILSGLEPGERYVLQPPARLGDGAPIEVTS